MVIHDLDVAMESALRTALFRLTDKVSRLLVRCMLEPPLALVAVRGPRAYAEWAAKSGAAKVSQEIWTRARKLFLRHLEPFPAAVRRALHCNDEETFGAYYIFPWNNAFGNACEARLETWFTDNGTRMQRQVKAKMLDCLFDPEQRVAHTVEVMQRLRDLLVTEPSARHSTVERIMRPQRSIVSSITVGSQGMDGVLEVSGGTIVKMKLCLCNCYRDKCDPRLGQDGWSVRLLRDRELLARQLKVPSRSSLEIIISIFTLFLLIKKNNNI